LQRLGAVLRFVKGQAAPETGRAFARARELWEQLGFPAGYLHIPYGQSRYHGYRGEFELATRLDEDLLRLSLQRNDSSGLILGHQACGSDQMLVGKFASARTHYEEALALSDPISHHSLAHQTGSHPQVVARAYLGFVLLCLGLPDQASTLTSAAIAEARTLAHPPTLASSLMVEAMLLSLVGNNRALNERTDELVVVAVEQGVPWWHTAGTTYRGWVKVNNGNVAEGMSLMRSGLTAYRATGAEMWIPYHTTLRARACEIAGQIEEGLTLLDDALQLSQRTGECWFAAELDRHKGELLLRHGHSEAAEELYRKALSIAVEQEAKLWELRAAVSLARLRRDQDRRAEARDLLAPVYGWFTEGFDTPDLKEAKALLDELR
jgi:predicted ATPase